jgi:hypothetical protein
MTMSPIFMPYPLTRRRGAKKKPAALEGWQIASTPILPLLFYTVFDLLSTENDTARF